MFKNYLQTDDPIITVFIFNARDVKWDEINGNYTIRELINYIYSKFKINYCSLNINNIEIDFKKEKNKKLNHYIYDYKSLTIKISY